MSEITTEIAVRSQSDFVTTLKQRREMLGLSCLELDDKAGFHQGYTSHLEHPQTRSGRGSLRLNPMAQVWLDALGLELVVRDRGREKC